MSSSSSSCIIFLYKATVHVLLTSAAIPLYVPHKGPIKGAVLKETRRIRRIIMKDLFVLKVTGVCIEFIIVYVFRYNIDNMI